MKFNFTVFKQKFKIKHRNPQKEQHVSQRYAFYNICGSALQLWVKTAVSFTLSQMLCCSQKRPSQVVLESSTICMLSNVRYQSTRVNTVQFHLERMGFFTFLNLVYFLVASLIQYLQYVLVFIYTYFSIYFLAFFVFGVNSNTDDYFM